MQNNCPSNNFNNNTNFNKFANNNPYSQTCQNQQQGHCQNNNLNNNLYSNMNNNNNSQVPIVNPAPQKQFSIFNNFFNAFNGNNNQRQTKPQQSNQQPNNAQWGMFPNSMVSQNEVPRSSFATKESQPTMAMNNMPKDPNVTFEALDHATLNKINAMRGIPPIPEPTQTAPPMQTKEIIKEQSAKVVYTDKYIGRIGNLIQSSKNASIFYNYLEKIAKAEEHKLYFKQLSKENSLMSMELNNIYVTTKGKPFDAVQINPTFSFDFKKGLQVGIREESQSLKDLSDIFNETTDEGTQKLINTLIYKKISDINMMNTMIPDIS